MADVRAARRLTPLDPKLLLLQKQIEKAIHSATYKDYYEILGVSRSVTLLHPDLALALPSKVVPALHF